MRPIERITPTLDLLEEVWRTYPDMRLGQLVMNAARDEKGSIRDPWYIEDDELRAGLRQLMGQE